MAHATTMYSPGGPRVMATAVMHAGQSWAGATQLTGIHMTAVCKPAIPCTDDTTDFYRMDPDGMRYFGGDGRTPGDVRRHDDADGPRMADEEPAVAREDDGTGNGYQNAGDGRPRCSGMNNDDGSAKLHERATRPKHSRPSRRRRAHLPMRSMCANSAGRVTFATSGTRQAWEWCDGWTATKRRCSPGSRFPRDPCRRWRGPC